MAPALAMVASVTILFGVAAIMAVVVATACGVALLRAIGAIRPAKRAVAFADDATIEGVVVRGRTKRFVISAACGSKSSRCASLTERSASTK